MKGPTPFNPSQLNDIGDFCSFQELVKNPVLRKQKNYLHEVQNDEFEEERAERNFKKIELLDQNLVDHGIFVKIKRF